MTLRASRRTESSPACAPSASTASARFRPTSDEPRRISIQTQQQFGKYLVSSSARRDHGGRFYTALLAIRSGRGSMTHERVVRFDSQFDSHDAALGFAQAQAAAWIGERNPGHQPLRTE
jgi:hypothetical protein